ncbi:MAG: hypothetical protein LAO30_20920 [Acidobacteriia bacterium]|nr:hypothetical protein [Terriglobia bacterium]
MMMFRMAACAMVMLLGSMGAQESSPSCKPVTHYGVSGCERLPDQSCPPGYHQQIVDPPNPRMKAPSYIMCVADQPQPKEKPPSKPPKSNGSE